MIKVQLKAQPQTGDAHQNIFAFGWRSAVRSALPEHFVQAFVVPAFPKRGKTCPDRSRMDGTRSVVSCKVGTRLRGILRADFSNTRVVGVRVQLPQPERSIPFRDRSPHKESVAGQTCACLDRPSAIVLVAAVWFRSRYQLIADFNSASADG